MAAIDWNKMNAPDGGEFAAWMLSLLDEGDQRFATTEMPSWLPDDRLDDAEAAGAVAPLVARREELRRRYDAALDRAMAESQPVNGG